VNNFLGFGNFFGEIGEIRIFNRHVSDPFRGKVTLAVKTRILSCR